MQRRVFCVCIAMAVGGLFLFSAFQAKASHGEHLVISEVQITGGAGKTAHDFVELYNSTGTAVDLNGMRLVKRTTTGTSDTTLKSWTESALVPGHGFYLWANKDFSAIGIVPDVTMSGTLADNNAVALRRGAENTGEIIDAVGWGTAANTLVEGAVFSQNPTANQTLERKPGGAEGHGIDTGNNAQDFFLQNAPNPKNSGSGAVPAIEVAEETKVAKAAIDKATEEPKVTEMAKDSSATSGSVVINEFLPNPLGSGNEWVELFNTTAGSIDLADWKLQDGTADNIKTLSGTIAAQGFLVVELTSARLNNSGDRIMLRSLEGTMIDGVSYGDWNDGNIADNAPAPVRAGQAVARRSNGADTASDKADFALTDSPTPGSGNVIAVSTIVPVGGGSAPPTTVVAPNPKILINEFVADPEDGPEWVELFNAGEVSVDLDDWRLEDGSEAKTKLAGTLVPGHFKVVRDIEGNLNNKGDIIRLKNAKGEMIDRVAFGVWEDGSILDNAPAAEDPNSVARRKDGVDTDNNAADFAVTAKVTKGRENVIEATVEKVEEVKKLNKVEDPKPIQPSPTPPPPSIPPNPATPATTEASIADLRDLEVGTKVRVQGVVAVPPGVLGTQIFYLAGSGIQIYSSKRAFPELKFGDVVRVEGVLGEAQGERRIKIKGQESVEVVGHGAPPTSHEIDAEELGEDLAGTLVRVFGTLIDVTRNQLVLDDGQNEITVSIKKTTGLDTREFAPGLELAVVGIVAPDKNGWRILPRFPEDIVVTENVTKVAKAAKESKVAEAAKESAVSSGSSATSTQGHPYAEATALASGGGALAAAVVRRRKLLASAWRALAFLLRRKNTD